ncbi:MAG: hypothetical protein ACJ76H_17275 [Bacteriovoracaceae bacterium]
MKEKLSGVSSQFLILALAGILLLLTIQMAKAQVMTGANMNMQNNLQSNNVITTKMPRKSSFGKILERTSLNYYHQFLGPTIGGPSNETFNVFQTGVDQPKTGRAPIQSFQSALIRYDMNQDWGIGASLAMSNGYGGTVVNRDSRGDVTNKSDAQFYNARAYVFAPKMDVGIGTLFSTFGYEAPTSTISRQDHMNMGLVITEQLAFKNPSLSSKWSGGVTGQIYRMFYGHNNQKKVPGCDPDVCVPTQLQTQIVTISPYVNYRMSDKWNWGNMAILDWDQRGVQANSREFNNNLPNRLRSTLSYYPNRWYITNIGVFAQPLVKMRPSTTAMGAEVAFRF